MSNDEQNKIEPERRAYFYMMPNIIDDMGLSVYAFRLYCHIKRVAGDAGECWQGTKTLSEKCRMSGGMVSNAKKELVQAGLIKINEVHHKTGMYHSIEITDVWLKNMTAFHGVKSPFTTEKAHSPHETKNTPSVKTNDEEPSQSIKEPTTTDEFTILQRTVEELTGYPLNGQADVRAINDMITLGITPDDLRDAVAWFADNGKVVRGAAQLLGSAKTSKARRTQQGSRRAAAVVPEYREVIV